MRAHDDYIGARRGRSAHDFAGRLPNQYLAANRDPASGKELSRAGQPASRPLDEAVVEGPHLPRRQAWHLLDDMHQGHGRLTAAGKTERQLE